MSVPFALSSAVAYGFGDFAGGLAARRTPVLRVTAVAQVAGLRGAVAGGVPGAGARLARPRSGSGRWRASAG